MDRYEHRAFRHCLFICQMAYLDFEQATTVILSRDDFDRVCLNLLEKCFPFSPHWPRDLGLSPPTTMANPQGQKIVDSRGTQSYDSGTQAATGDGNQSRDKDAADVKAQIMNNPFNIDHEVNLFQNYVVGTNFHKRLLTGNPLISAKIPNNFHKNLISSYKKSTSKGGGGVSGVTSLDCGEYKKLKDYRLDMKRRELKADFVRCKKYVEDDRELVCLYKKYEIPMDKFVSIQLNELTRWAITESFQKRFVDRTIKDTFFADKPPFKSSHVLLDGQMNYLKNMYVVTHDNIKKIHASSNMKALSAKMYSIFMEIFDNFIEHHTTQTSFVHTCMKTANEYASSLNNISHRRNYNSLAIVLTLGMVVHGMSYVKLTQWLRDSSRMSFSVDSGFGGDEVLLQEVIETEFTLLKPMEKIYRYINHNNYFDYENPLNVLCSSNKCYADVIPAIYAEFCLLRLVMLLTDGGRVGDRYKYLDKTVLQATRNKLEDWTDINDLGDDDDGGGEESILDDDARTRANERMNQVKENIHRIAGNLTAAYPGLFTALLHMCVTLFRKDLVISILRDLRLLHSKDYHKDRRESIELSKRISYKFANICRLVTFNVITSTNTNTYMVETIKKLLDIPTFLLFNAGGDHL